MAVQKNASPKESPTAVQRRRHTKKMSISGVVLHVQAIIEQGRIKEFLEACKAESFDTLKGPVGLIAFTRKFIAEPPHEAATSSRISKRTPAAIAVREMATANAKMIDDCPC